MSQAALWCVGVVRCDVDKSSSPKIRIVMHHVVTELNKDSRDQVSDGYDRTGI